MHNKNYKLKNRGVTLMEVLMVIVIISIIGGVTFYYFGNLNKKEALEKDVAGLTALLRHARLLSVSSKNAATFGVHLESSKAILFEGPSFSSALDTPSSVEFSKYVHMMGYSLNGGGEDIIFSRLLGYTDNHGSITLSLVDDSASTTITVIRTGVIQ